MIKNLYLVIAALSLVGCVDHPETSELDILQIQNAVKSMNVDWSKEYVVPPTELPKEITALNPKEVKVTEFGVYLVLTRRFGQESGLFVSPQFGSLESFGTTRAGWPNFVRVDGYTFTYTKL